MKSHAKLTSAFAVVAALGVALAPAADARIASGTQTANGYIESAINSDSVRFVAPMDLNPTTREWYQDGEIEYNVYDGFDGKIIFGYQVGYPATVGGNLTFSWSTPSISLTTSGPSASLPIPTATASISVGLGPGIRDVWVTEGSAKSGHGVVTISAFHGSVSGVLGPVNLRPYVQLRGNDGSTVTTYGRMWVG